MKKILLVIILLTAVLFGGYSIFKESFDRFNPFIKKEYVYVEINDAPTADDGRFKYRVTGYNVDGEEKKVTFTTSIILEEGTYVKALVKGSYTESFEMITENELPEDIF
ncbi:YxeA family protein [Sutcliffiella horikoshii]|uniref:YxeA family protein n=1 Tax=Sutcliffiella horikoshii TaxID=79883 RepID=UPI00204115F3|nr:YxeA family protein [Sutcliffiella horikoshii]MCM3618409.1 YxeA family protein [Sutcliffiella horikoshii]